ncbi:MAG: hypothetical protein RJB11_2954 [Planctomycetota bacterium]
MCVALELSADEGNHTSRSVLLTAKTLQLGWRPPVNGYGCADPSKDVRVRRVEGMLKFLIVPQSGIPW